MSSVSLTDYANWTLSTPNGIRYRVKSRDGQFQLENASVVETYIIRAADLLDFAIEAMPYPIAIGGFVFYEGGRTLPGVGTLVVQQINWRSLDPELPVDPFSGDSPASSQSYLDFIEVDLHYAPRPIKTGDTDVNDPLTFLEISATASASFLSVGPKGATYEPLDTDEDTASGDDDEDADDSSEEIGTSIDEDGTIKDPNIGSFLTEPETEWSVRWSQIPADFWSGTLLNRLRGKLGKINDGSMTTLYGAPAGTVLFTGFNYRQMFTWRPDDDNTETIAQPPIVLDLKFTEKNFRRPDGVRVTWNMAYIPEVGGYRRIEVNARRPYATTNLDKIFSP